MSYSITHIVGRLSQDPEVRQFGAGKSVTEITIETESSYKGKDGVEVKKQAFDKVTVWGPAGTNAAKFLRAGSQVACIAHSESRDWNGKKITNLVSDRLDFLDKAGSAPAPLAAAQRTGGRPVTVEDPIDDDSIPF